MQVAQVTQRRFILFTHAAGKVRVVQVLVARGLRHIFQDAQAILNGALAVRRHLLPLGEHVVADVILLLPGQRIPDTDAILQFLTLRGTLLLQRAIVIEDALFFLRR